VKHGIAISLLSMPKVY